ncbi:F10A5.30 [Arabidopsis thaliana]|uniref:F10A5.30 n=1 Tax=Arabidopsis thaliana TaxID=3702 RepID=Q9LQZ1_ARATH|nr:F10A5.30 [Arabidopsis thaliana]
MNYLVRLGICYDGFDSDKNAFEWGSSAIPHSEDAIQDVTEQTPSKKVLSNLIYNYKPTYYAGRGFDEVYIFTQPRSRF